jgi:predicted aminopeptidase
MGKSRMGCTDYRLVYAEDEAEAEAKLEQAMGCDTFGHGSDSYTLHDFEAHEAIQ